MKSVTLIVALCAARCAYPADIRVAVATLDSGTSDRADATYAIRATVVSSARQDVSYAIMKCSWNSSFRIEPKETLSARPWGCDGNSPISFLLKPGVESEFQFQVTAKSSSPPPARMRIGFVLAPWPWDLKSPSPGSDLTSPVVWSDWVELPPAKKQRLPESHHPN
jgi:hypothetical protein